MSLSVVGVGDRVLDEAEAWALVLAVRQRVGTCGPICGSVGFRMEGQTLLEVEAEDAAVVARCDLPDGWSRPPKVCPAWRCPEGSIAARVFDLYMPLCVGDGRDRFIVAHLAQSLDGRVATGNGSSQFISGHEDLVHTHRLRALFDAVLVGASTIEHDDPQLTTRLVSGPNPVRVVIDPRGRLGPNHRVFCDGQAPTILLRGADNHGPDMPSQTTVVPLSDRGGGFEIQTIVDALAGLGLRRIFIEGGGVTVSRFLRARAIDRLHVTVAPLVIGSGRPAFTLPDIDDLHAALRLQVRHFGLGTDMLFDCPLPKP